MFEFMMVNDKLGLKLNHVLALSDGKSKKIHYDR